MITREEYLSLSEEKRAEIKALHKAVRSDTSFGERTRNLAWAFLRGFKFRRVERSHRMQAMGMVSYWPDQPLDGYVRTEEGRFYEHNLPSGVLIASLLAKHSPEFLTEFESKDPRNHYKSLNKTGRITAWLLDRTGAIPAPALRPKKPYVAASAAE